MSQETLVAETTAETSTETEDSPQKPGADSGLWSGLSIPVIGIAGEFASGKTTFLLDAPTHPERSIFLDFESSTATYDEDRKRFMQVIHVPDVIAKKNGGQYDPGLSFPWFVEFVNSLKGKSIQCICIDTVGDLEQGLVEYTTSMYHKFGYSSTESFQKMGGVFWNAVKITLESVIHQLLTSTECLLFSSHMRQKFVNNKKVDKREPRGKESWYKLCHLFIQLVRVTERVEEDGRLVSRMRKKPAGIILKSRLAIRTDEIDEYGDPLRIPIVGSKLDVCTPGRLRKLIIDAKRGIDRFNAEEVELERKLSEREKLELAIQQEELRAEAAQSALERARIIASAKTEIQSKAGHEPEMALSDDSGKHDRNSAASSTSNSDEDEETYGILEDIRSALHNSYGKHNDMITLEKLIYKCLVRVSLAFQEIIGTYPSVNDKANLLSIVRENTGEAFVRANNQLFSGLSHRLKQNGIEDDGIFALTSCVEKSCKNLIGNDADFDSAIYQEAEKLREKEKKE